MGISHRNEPKEGLSGHVPHIDEYQNLLTKSPRQSVSVATRADRHGERIIILCKVCAVNKF